MSKFHFKHFSVEQERSALKVGTDSMILGSFIDYTSRKKGLDIGAGTGVLSLMVAQSNPEIQIDAIEIDDESVIDCKTNFECSNWSERLNVIHSDFLAFPFQNKYDLIFSNPPFYHNSLLSSDERTAISKHSFHLPFDRLFEKVNHLLTDNGHFWLIIPAEHTQTIKEIAKENQLFLTKEIAIYGKPEKQTRSILSFSKIEKPNTTDSITIREVNGNYTEQYIKLTKDFHFKNLT